MAIQSQAATDPVVGAISPVARKVIAAFVVGVVLGVFSVVQFVPSKVATRSGGLFAGDEFSEGGEVLPGEAGGDLVVDSQGRLIRRSGGRSGSTAGGTTSGGTAGTAGRAGGKSGAGANVGGGTGGSGGSSGGSGSAQCKAGANGGSTDTGISGSEIRLASTVVTDGAGSNFLGDSPIGMEAMVRRVNNREGGICGRTIKLETRNDSWDAARGRTFIEDFINSKQYFALPVVPSSEGLSAAISAGVIDRGAIPVVGTDGMRKEQYEASGKASWVWPVSVATVSQVRIMAKVAYDRGARTFGIVYDRKYKFGVEGADAYEDYLKTLSGASLKIRMGIEPVQSSYPEANQFTGACNPCDLVVLLVEPETGKTWMASAGIAGRGKVMTAGAQPLFNDRFARGCGSVCDGMFVWSGYNPAIGTNTSKGGIAKYMGDVRAINPSVDVTNQFLQGAYLGMQVFVNAMKSCSPGLTRACVKQKMDSLDYSSDFTAPLSWRPGNHFANLGARAYSIAYSQGSFSGWRDEQTGFVRDPTPGVVPG